MAARRKPVAGPRLLVQAGACLAALLSMPAQALGLGEIAVQSYLGQPLRATIALIGADDEDALRTCVKARLQTMDGALIGTPAVSAGRDGRGLNLIVTSTQKLYEPVITLVIDATCDGRTQREYAILLDPLEWPSSAQALKPAGVAVAAAPRESVKPGAGPTVNPAPRADSRFKPLPPPRAPMVIAKPSAAMTSQTAPAKTAPAPAVKPETVKPPAKAPQTAAPVRNVLRLSNSDTGAAGATTVGTPESLADTEQRLKEVQARLVMLGMATPPAKPAPAAGPIAFSTALDQTELQMAQVRAQIRALQIETENMSSKELRPRPAVKLPPAPAAAVAVAAPPPVSDNFGLLAVLGVLLVGCVAVIAMMMRRMRQLKKYREHLDPF